MSIKPIRNREGRSKYQSSKKLRSSGESNFTINQNVGYRLINFVVFSFISECMKYKECGGDVQILENSRRGLGLKIVIKCQSCMPKEINSCPLVKNAYEVNRRFLQCGYLELN